jgi:hypothetical protein
LVEDLTAIRHFTSLAVNEKLNSLKVEVERPNAERPKAEVEKPKEQQRKGRMTCAN